MPRFRLPGPAPRPQPHPPDRTAARRNGGPHPRRSAASEFHSQRAQSRRRAAQRVRCAPASRPRTGERPVRSLKSAQGAMCDPKRGAQIGRKRSALPDSCLRRSVDADLFLTKQALHGSVGQSAWRRRQLHAREPIQRRSRSAPHALFGSVDLRARCEIRRRPSARGTSRRFAVLRSAPDAGSAPLWLEIVICRQRCAARNRQRHNAMSVSCERRKEPAALTVYTYRADRQLHRLVMWPTAGKPPRRGWTRGADEAPVHPRDPRQLIPRALARRNKRCRSCLEAANPTAPLRATA